MQKKLFLRVRKSPSFQGKRRIKPVWLADCGIVEASEWYFRKGVFFGKKCVNIHGLVRGKTFCWEVFRTFPIFRAGLPGHAKGLEKSALQAGMQVVSWIIHSGGC
jgi:hypothetical protein